MTNPYQKHEPSLDPLLQQLASSNTFDSDWPTLRHHLQLSLLASLQLFLAKGPPRPYRPPQSSAAPPLDQTSTRTETSSPTIGATDRETSLAESLLLSPSQPVSQLDPGQAGAGAGAGFSAGETPTQHMDIDLQPSTPGGLIIPPFPPLDRHRRRSPSPFHLRQAAAAEAAAAAEVAASGGQSVGGVGMPPRTNGMPNQRMVAMGMGVPDEDWDDEVVIGGKKLVGWMEEEQGKREVDRLSRLLDDMEVPPFTIQRLAELLLQPDQHHTTFGKFIRAIEKSLLVTSPWEPPSYTYVAPTAFGPRSFPASSSVSSSASSDGYDTDSTVPPGSNTPLFSPIPFLVHPAHIGEEGVELNGGSEGGPGRSREEGLMSPLMLDDGTGGGTGSAASGTSGEEKGYQMMTGSARSPTPEPEDADDAGDKAGAAAERTAAASAAASGNGDVVMTSTEDPVPLADADASTSADIDVDPSTPPSPASIPRPSNPLPPSPSVPTTHSTSHSSPSVPDPANTSYLGRVDELDTGPLPLSPTPLQPEDSKRRASLASTDSSYAREPRTDTADEGGLVAHGMSEKPVPISSTTVLSDGAGGGGGERTVRSLPRGASEKSLGERFVSKGVVDDGVAAEAMGVEEGLELSPKSNGKTQGEASEGVSAVTEEVKKE